MTDNGQTKKRGRKQAAFTRAPPIILDRRERIESKSTSTEDKKEEAKDTVIPFMRRPAKFNTDAILKNLTDYPGHFVIGIIGKQGVGKSTILSQFAQLDQVFSTQPCDQFLISGHKTEGIDMYVTPERAILLDTEPVLSWSVLEKVIRTENLDGLNPDVWLEMDNIYTVLFLLSVCHVVLVVNDKPEIDLDILQLIQRAEALKFNIPDYPLLTGQQDMNYYPDIGIQGLVQLGSILPSFITPDTINIFFLPDQQDNTIESFDILACELRDQVTAAPRKSGKKGQVSEKDWFKNAYKIYELIHKSDYITEYLQVVRKLRDS
ncbi:hypothetical protein RMCBS344292_18482 [Rhizopus microsporus]|nr:hypothetical protein RMCBS344292_18482 [Rhizopus microsporus]